MEIFGRHEWIFAPVSVHNGLCWTASQANILHNFAMYMHRKKPVNYVHNYAALHNFLCYRHNRFINLRICIIWLYEFVQIGLNAFESRDVFPRSASERLHDRIDWRVLHATFDDINLMTCTCGRCMLAQHASAIKKKMEKKERKRQDNFIKGPRFAHWGTH